METSLPLVITLLYDFKIYFALLMRAVECKGLVPCNDVV